MITGTASQATICAITAIEADKQPLCASAGWPGAHGQSTRAWASQARRLRADVPSTPPTEPPPLAAAVAASAPALPARCSSGSTSGTPATASFPPHREWVVWTYLPGPEAAHTHPTPPGRARVSGWAGGRAWAAPVTPPAPPAPAHGLLMTAGGLGFGSSSYASGGSEYGGSGSGSSYGSCYSRCSGGGSGPGAGMGGGRLLLLASITTSASASSSSRPSSSAVAAPAGAAPAPAVAGTPPSGGAAAAGAGLGLGSGAAGLFRGFNMPQISLMPAGRLPGASPHTGGAAGSSFAADQELAAELYDYHIAKHGGMPRPCPRCHSKAFFERGPPPASSSSAALSSSAAPAASAPTASAASGVNSTPSGGGGGGGGGEVVAWRSRPLCCDMCGAWVHMGCARVNLLEQVPPRPWFHSHVCRNNYIRLEAAAEQNPHASSDSPSSQLYILTPADHAAYAAMAARAAGGGISSGTSSGISGSSAGGGGGMTGRPRGPAGSVIPLLAQGFNRDAIEGFGEPAREYDGGRYSAVLVAGRQPVAAASFNVWGREAQLCMLATATAARRKGHGAALVADVEGLLKRLGVQRMLVQARRVALPMWLGPRFGYSLVAPEAAEELHAQMPVAYYDCALLEKWL